MPEQIRKRKGANMDIDLESRREAAIMDLLEFFILPI